MNFTQLVNHVLWVRKGVKSTSLYLGLIGRLASIHWVETLWWVESTESAKLSICSWHLAVLCFKLLTLKLLLIEAHFLRVRVAWSTWVTSLESICC